jgi:ferredoxin-NADP reductase
VAGLDGAALARSDVYVAGPEAFVRAAEFALRGAGVPAGSLSTFVP